MPSHAHFDHVTRDELPVDAHAVADTLDEWIHRAHGLTSSAHGAGLFLDLLAEHGYRIAPTGSATGSVIGSAAGPVRWSLPPLAWVADVERVAERFDQQAGKSEQHIGTIAGAEIAEAAWSRAATWLRNALPTLDAARSTHLEARVSPDGFVAQRMTLQGEPRWILSYLTEAGFTVREVDDAEAADWPPVLAGPETNPEPEADPGRHNHDPYRRQRRPGQPAAAAAMRLVRRRARRLRPDQSRRPTRAGPHAGDLAHRRPGRDRRQRLVGGRPRRRAAAPTQHVHDRRRRGHRFGYHCLTSRARRHNRGTPAGNSPPNPRE
jgi:hypothetical protein